jgi:hypothetical protein
MVLLDLLKFFPSLSLLLAAQILFIYKLTIN